MFHLSIIAGLRDHNKVWVKRIAILIGKNDRIFKQMIASMAKWGVFQITCLENLKLVGQMSLNKPFKKVNICLSFGFQLTTSKYGQSDTVIEKCTGVNFDNAGSRLNTQS